jgi:hypothetical protein
VFSAVDHRLGPPCDKRIELHFSGSSKINITKQIGQIGLKVSQKYFLLKQAISVHNFAGQGNEPESMD